MTQKCYYKCEIKKNDRKRTQQMARQITNESTYEQAFQVSVKAIKLVWKIYYSLREKMEYADFYQECALVFFRDLATQFSPPDAVLVSCQSYKWVALSLLKKHKRFPQTAKEELFTLQSSDIDTPTLVEDRDWLESNPLNLKPIDWKICQLLMSGYQLREISKITSLAFNTLQFHLKPIRKTLAEYYGIQDYSKMRRTYKLTSQQIKKGADRPRAKAVACYKEGVLIRTYGSGGEACEAMGFPRHSAAIFGAIRRKGKSAGYEWKFV